MEVKKVLLLTLLLILLGVRIAYVEINSENYYWDELVFLHLGEQIEQGTYSSVLGEEYRPPLFPFLLSFTGIEGAHLLVFLFVCLSILLVFMLGKEIFNTNIGLIAAIIFGSMHLYFFYSFKLLTEPIAICWMLFSLIFLYKYEKEKKPIYMYLIGFFLGLTLLTRYLCLIFIGAIFIYSLYKKWLNKELLFAGIIFFITILPLFILGVINYDNPLGMLIVNFSGNTEPNGTIFYYIINIISILGAFVLAFFLIGLYDWKETKPLLLFMGLYFIALSIISTRDARFFLLLFPFFALMAARGLEKLKTLGLVLLIIFVGINLYLGVNSILTDADNTKFLIDTASSLDLNGTVMSNSPIYFLYFSDMNVTNFPKDNEDISKIDFFIIDNYHPREDYYYINYTNYINNNKKELYKFTWEHREIKVYGT